MKNMFGASPSCVMRGDSLCVETENRSTRLSAAMSGLLDKWEYSIAKIN